MKSLLGALYYDELLLHVRRRTGATSTREVFAMSRQPQALPRGTSVADSSHMWTSLAFASLLACAPALALAQPPADEPAAPPSDLLPGDTPPPSDDKVYAAKHTREAGGYAGLMIAPAFHSVTVAPTFGWFIEDRVQLTTILALSNLRAGESSTTIVQAMIEPSYHLKLDARTYAFAGAGFGYSYVQDLGSGLTFAIRIGWQYLIGRNGVFSPSVSYDLRTNKADRMSDVAEVAAASAIRFNFGYTTVF